MLEQNLETKSLRGFLSDSAYYQAKVEQLRIEKRKGRASYSPYRENPLAFVRDCIEFPRGMALAPYQEDILSQFYSAKRMAVRGPHGLGKTALAAWVVLWAILTSEDVKVPVTASAWRQLSKFLFPEIHKWAKRLRWDKLGRAPFTRDELLTLSIKLGAAREAFALASNNPELIEGAHAERLVYVFDEAKAIPDATWDAAEGAFSTGDCYALAISTPGARGGRFYEIHRRAAGFEAWRVRHVTLTEAIEAGRISRTWAEDRKRQWGESSPVYQARVLGEFPEQADDALISLAWIEQARERELEPSGEPMAGCDIARFGEDDSCMLTRQGECVLSIDIWHGHDTMTTTGRIKQANVFCNVDAIGVGAGVVDRLVELGHPCVGVNIGERALDRERFVNLRAEGYWLLRERFQLGQIDLSRVPREVYDRLSGELTALTFSYQSDGRIKLEAKEDMKKRLGRSPDVADALMLAFLKANSRASAEWV